MIEKVNNISLDLTYYSGNDLYSDGAIEDELLKLVQTHDETELNGLIRDNFSWPLLYHFSQIRQNIVTWLPIKKDQSVLEIGAGCGAITGGLARMADHVTCIELSKKRSLINANRNKSYSNIEIKVGNFTDIEPNLTEKYDYITLIGVFEYAECYISSESPYIDFLNRIKKHLKPDGKIVIAIENRIGMKYISGCKEDHTARIGEGLDDYPVTSGVKTFDKSEISSIFEKAGFTDFHFYYPYPDYKLPLEIYSDSYLPKKGSLTQNINNLDQNRMFFFDESKAFDKAIELGMFDQISNSFEIILENPNETENDKVQPDNQIRTEKCKEELEVIYAKFSNDRSAQYAIQTQIVCDDNHVRYVKKVPDTPVAQMHVDQIYRNEQILLSAYKGTRFIPNKVVEKGNALLFEFVDGSTLEKELDYCLLCNDKVRFYSLLESFVKELEQASKEYFNIDFIPANVIICDGNWHVIDYEWVYKKDDIPVANPDICFLIYRALHYYLGVSKLRRVYVDEKELFAHFGLDDMDVQKYSEMEKDFQKKLDGNYYKLMTAKNDHHKVIVDANQTMADFEEKQWELNLKIYYKDQQEPEEKRFKVTECGLNTICLNLHFEHPVDKLDIGRPDGKYVYGLEHAYAIQGDKKVECENCFIQDVLIGHEQVFLDPSRYLSLDFTKQRNLSDIGHMEIYLRETRVHQDITHVLDLKELEISQQKEYIAGLKENIRRLENAVNTMENSSSWKITGPLRKISCLMHGEKNG